MNLILALALLAQPRPLVIEARAELPKLGAARCHDREAAQSWLVGLAYRDPHVLDEVVAPGLTHRDPEIRSRCHAIARRVRPCKRCEATGWIGETFGWDGNQEHPCEACHGFGSDWLASLLSMSRY